MFYLKLVLFGFRNLAETGPRRVAAVRRLGFTVALVDPCGFGVLGSRAGDAFGEFDARFVYTHKIGV